MMPLEQLPERMRDCQHSPAPTVHRIGLASGGTIEASKCLRCGLWLDATPAFRPAALPVDDAGVCT